jgi:hypothetical protein
MSELQADPNVQDPSAAVDPPNPDPAPAADPAPAVPDTSWVPKRIGEVTAARRKAEEERDAERAKATKLEEELARLRAAHPPADGAPVEKTVQAGMTQEDFDKLVNARAESIANQRTDVESMNSKIAQINAAGTKEFGDDFDKSVQNLNVAGVGGPEFLKVLTNVPQAEKVVTWLGKNENVSEAIRIASMDPVQMGIELTKLSAKAAKELGKQISKAPAPITPVDGRGAPTGDGVEPDPSDQKAWIAWRQKSARKGRK